jgi:hypothetical protein
MMHLEAVDPLRSSLGAIIRTYTVSSRGDIEILAKGVNSDRRWMFKIHREGWHASLDDHEFWTGNINEKAERDQVLLGLLNVPGCSIYVNDKGGLAVLSQNPLIAAAFLAQELETTG